MSETHTHLVNQLPPETLAEILCLVPPKGVELTTRNNHPWKLALVCRFWRDVIFSTPQLWSNITVHLDPVRESRLDIRADALIAAWRICLERSRNYPLTIHIDASSSKSMPFIPSFLTPLMEHVQRWESTTFGFPIELLLPFVSNHNIQYSCLRNVILRGGAVTTIPEINLFRDAPLLSHISLQEFLYPPGRINLPWNQFTDLTMYMNRGDIPDLLDTLRNIPNLTTFEFSAFALTPTFRERPNQTLQLPHLRKLSWITYILKISDFFDSVSMPNLSELSFQCEDDSWNMESMQHFLRRSKCTITSITLSMTSSLLASSFLRLLPDIEFLKLYSVFGNEELMRTLTFDESAISWVGPRLKRIVMDTVRIGSHEAFIVMVQSRLRASDTAVPSRGRRLEHLQLELSPYPDSSHVGLFEAFNVLQKRLSPEETALVTYKERTPGES